MSLFFGVSLYLSSATANAALRTAFSASRKFDGPFE